MNINLRIERLILDGITIPAGQWQLLQTSVTAELQQMLTKNGLVTNITQGASLSRISTDGIQVNGGNNPVQLGQQVAQSIYRGIGRE